MDPFIGQIMPYGFNFNPRGWYHCNGGLLAISTNTTLFSLLGTFYGGDGRTTFGLPDLRGKSPMSFGRHPGSIYDWRMGQAAGAESHTLTQMELANHSHSATFVPGPADTVAQVQVSTDAATTDTPAEGSYLARNDGGREDGVFMYRPDAGSGVVSLGGVTGGNGMGGTVMLQSTGGSTSFSILQPVQVVNYCVAYMGIYPPRS